MIFADYTRRVRDDYQQKKEAGRLSLELAEPTPSRLRDMCLLVFTERYDRRDERILEKFFGKTQENKTRWKTIQSFDLDKLKPLANYLKTSTAATDPKNIELLAWLIDYKGRPYEFEKKEDDAPMPTDPANQAPPALTNATSPEPSPITNHNNRIPPEKRNPAIILTIMLALVGAGLYLTLTKGFFKTGPQACMVWTGDHYRPIPCKQNSATTPAIPLDSEKMARFRKITRPDTITENALGNIWYAKYNNNYECYTAPGSQPIDSNLKLRPLTDYVLLRYIHPGLQPTAILPQR